MNVQSFKKNVGNHNTFCIKKKICTHFKYVHMLAQILFTVGEQFGVNKAALVPVE